MREKHIFYTELAYVMGLLALALGTALMERADFGVSMVVAPAYLVHLKLSETLPFFTFGMAEYTFQALLLVVMMVVLRRFRISYLFSFVTAVVYGLTLDGAIGLVGLFPGESFPLRLAFFLLGMLFCSIGVSFFFHTYISPEVYELFVKELSAKYGFQIHKCKTVYDCVSCLLGVVLSFVFFGFGVFEGVKWGTIFCALVNGWLIGQCSGIFERIWRFEDRWALRRYFGQEKTAS